MPELCHIKAVDSLAYYWFMFSIRFSDKVRSDVGSIDRPVRHHGIAGHAELLLPQVHVLVPTVDGHWRLLSLVLFAHVSHYLSYWLIDGDIKSPLLIPERFYKARLRISSSTWTRIQLCTFTTPIELCWASCVYSTSSFMLPYTCCILHPDPFVRR